VTAALLGFAAVFALALMRVPLAFAMGFVGFVGLGLLRGWAPTAANAAQVVYDTGFAYTLSVVPLFILMGNFVARAGLATELFRAAHAFVGHVRGGLAHATVIACAGFGAICGSSIATAATMSKVAYPQMKKLGYADYLAAGVVAAGGTLGIMIPPSTILIIYGIVTETHIGKLFAAGVLPGLLCAALMMAGILWATWRDPNAGPAAAPASWAERWRSLRGIWGVVVLVVLVLGGIYGGVFTATEGAGIGASGAFFFALARRALTWKVLLQILVESARTTAMLFAILIAAGLFSGFINFTNMSSELKDDILEMGLSPLAVVGAMMVVYIILGMIMEELAIVLLTLPVFFPVVTGMGFDPVWFGVLIVLVVQIGMISPPVGMNLFVLAALLRGVKLTALYRGVLPFCAALVAALLIVMEWPAVALWLPGFMK
jgi:tripartite ATP-independent transporter DctM subunit